MSQEGGIRAGFLRRKIALYKKTTEEDSSGQPVAVYVYDFSLMADARAVRGMERTQSGREEMAVMAYTFRTMFRETLSVTHKVKFNGQFFDVQGIAPMGGMNRRFMEIYCELLDAAQLVVRE